MLVPIVLMRFIGNAFLSAVESGILPVPLPHFLFGPVRELADGVWKAWGEKRDKATKRDDIEAVAKATAAQIRAEVAEIVADLAHDRPEPVREAMAQYLSQVPGAIRQTMRRPSDPTGTTVPPSMAMRGPDDILTILPTRMPRFHPGDRPLTGVDRELVELLGIGGFGEVWKARNPSRPRIAHVALKFCIDPAAKAALLTLEREAALLDRVTQGKDQAGIVPLLETYLNADPPCLEYEFVEGGELTALIQASGQSGHLPTPAQASAIVGELARTVGRFHRLDPPLVHRDLKPANVLVKAREDGSLSYQISDFGIGGLAAVRDIERTRRGVSMAQHLGTSLRGSHTPLYASPEQMRGEPADPRDDVHALGVIWYQILTGDLTTGAQTDPDWPEELIARGMTRDQVKVLASCLSKPAKRPADAAVLADHIEASFGPKSAPRPAVATPEIEPPPLPRVPDPKPRANGSAATPAAGKKPDVAPADESPTDRVERRARPDTPPRAAAVAEEAKEEGPRNRRGAGRRRAVLAAVVIVLLMGLGAYWMDLDWKDWGPGPRPNVVIVPVNNDPQEGPARSGRGEIPPTPLPSPPPPPGPEARPFVGQWTLSGANFDEGSLIELKDDGKIGMVAIQQRRKVKSPVAATNFSGDEYWSFANGRLKIEMLSPHDLDVIRSKDGGFFAQPAGPIGAKLGPDAAIKFMRREASPKG